MALPTMTSVSMAKFSAWLRQRNSLLFHKNVAGRGDYLWPLLTTARLAPVPDGEASGLAAISWRISLEQALFAGKQCERPDGTASWYFGGAVASGKRTPEP